jgi:tetratricopeptide (TPR) repeat protein
LEIQEEHADKKSEASECQLAHSYLNVGGILYSKGDYEGALSHFMKAIELQESTVPKSLALADTYYCMALALRDNGDMEEALEKFQQSLEIHEKEASESLAVADMHANAAWILCLSNRKA